MSLQARGSPVTTKVRKLEPRTAPARLDTPTDLPADGVREISAARARRPARSQHRYPGRAGTQGRRHHDPLDRAYREAAADQGQRQELRSRDRYVAGTHERQ